MKTLQQSTNRSAIHRLQFYGFALKRFTDLGPLQHEWKTIGVVMISMMNQLNLFDRG